jgi:hypothetical protein
MALGLEASLGGFLFTSVKKSPGDLVSALWVSVLEAGQS